MTAIRSPVLTGAGASGASLMLENNALYGSNGLHGTINIMLPAPGDDRGLEKENYIFRDADGFNISDGESRHLGIEVALDVQLGTNYYAGLAGSWSEQTYRFDRNVAAGEIIVSGDDVDTAPGTLGSARLGYLDTSLEAELEWVHQGSYYMDAANSAKYSGHNLLNIRGLWHFDRRWSLGLRINNVLDARYADRADFAFGSFRYFPGREREWFLQIRYHSLSANKE